MIIVINDEKVLKMSLSSFYPLGVERVTDRNSTRTHMSKQCRW